jgi:hypothetical protein
MEPHVWSHNLFIFPIATYSQIFFFEVTNWRPAPLLFKHSHHFFGRAPVLTLKRPRLCQLSYQPNFVSGTTGRGEVLPIFFFGLNIDPQEALLAVAVTPLFLKVPSNLGCPLRRYF